MDQREPLKSLLVLCLDHDASKPRIDTMLEECLGKVIEPLFATLSEDIEFPESQRDLAACFVRWDGIGGHAIKALKENLSKRASSGLPLFLVGKFENPGEELLVRELGVIRAFSLPEEAEEMRKSFRRIALSFEQRGRLAILEKSFAKALETENWDEAQKAIDSLLFIDDRNQRYMLFLGMLYEKQGSLDKAEDIYQKILGNNSNNLKVKASLTGLFVKQGRHEEARKLSEETENMGSSLLEEILTTKVHMPNQNQAFKDIEKEFQQGDLATQFYQGRAEALASGGDVDGSIKYLRDVENKTQITSAKSIAAYKAGEIAAKANRTEAAEENLNRALTYSGGNMQVATDLLKEMKTPEYQRKITEQTQAAAEAKVAAAKPSVERGQHVSPPPPKDRQLEVLPFPINSGIKGDEILKDAREKFDKRRELVLEAKKTEGIFGKNIALLSEDPAGLAGFVRIMQNCGFVDISSFQRSSETLFSIRAGPPDVLVMWLHGGGEGTVRLLRTLMEDRTIPRFPVLVFCPGEDSRRKLVVQTSDVIFDRLYITVTSRSKLITAIEETVKTFNTEGGPQGLLREVRKFHLDKLHGEETEPLPASRFNQICDSIGRIPGKVYCAKTERVLRLIDKGDPQQAIVVTNLLTGEYPERLDAFLLLAEAKFEASNPPEEVATELFQVAFRSKDFSEEQAFLLGRLFYQYRAPATLYQLLDYWYKQEIWSKDCEFLYLVAGYNVLANRRKDVLGAVGSALKERAPRADFLALIADMLMTEKNWALARDFWKLIEMLPGANFAKCRINRVKCFMAQGQKGPAKNLIEEALKNFPKNAALISLSNELTGSSG